MVFHFTLPAYAFHNNILNFIYQKDVILVMLLYSITHIIHICAVFFNPNIPLFWSIFAHYPYFSVIFRQMSKTTKKQQNVFPIGKPCLSIPALPTGIVPINGSLNVRYHIFWLHSSKFINRLYQNICQNRFISKRYMILESL